MSQDPDYLWDGRGDDPEVARLEQLLGGFAHRAPLRAPPPRRRRPAMLGAAVVVAVAAVVILLWRARGEPEHAGRLAVATDAGPGSAPPAAGVRYDVHGGAARYDGAPAVTGTLAVGAWLETEVGAVAAMQIADIGDVRLEPGSRLRLVRSGPDQHRLELARGRLSARVTAPPRLFVVDTPTAAAVDLGCAYDLEVDAAGRTHLRVTSGAVSLEGRDRASWVPWGHEVVAVPGQGPGTPFPIDAAPALRDAVARFDAGDRGTGDRDSLAIIVGVTTTRDVVTLWNLLRRTDGADRARVFARLDALAIRPEWVLEDDVLAARPQALEDWRQSLEGTWNLEP